MRVSASVSIELFGSLAALRAQLYTYDTLLFHAIHALYHSLRHHISRCGPGSANVGLMMMMWCSEVAEDLLSSRLCECMLVI